MTQNKEFKNINFGTDLIVTFFRVLNNNNIDYAVLRNYEGLPDYNNSKDVDIIINSNVQKNAIHILIENAAKLNYQLVWKNKLDYLEGFVFVKLIDNEVFSVKIDLFNGFLWHGCSYVDQKHIFEKTTFYNGFKVPNKGHEAYIMIVYYLLYAKKIKKKYHIEIYENVKNNFIDFAEILNKSFSHKTAAQIISCIKTKNIEALTKMRKTIRNEIVRSNLKNRTLFGSYIRHFKCEVFDRRKMGVFIAFNGPDGAGKSTLVQPFIDLLYDLGLSPNNIPHHFLTKNIPSLHKLPGAPKKYAKQDYTKPYQAKKTGVLNSSVRTLYYYFAFLADRWLYINKMMRSNQVVVFDRYYLDLVADPSRIRISLNRNLVEKLFKTLPKPDYSMIILADKEQILSRKDELTEMKLTELLQTYSKIPNRLKACEVFYNTGSVEQGKSNLLKILFDKLEKSTK